MSKIINNQGIGMFDSGFGGLTVMRQIVKALPYESILYFGDTANVPYGNKSKNIIVRRTVECTKYLVSKKIKLLVIACHSASVNALEIIKKKYSIPVVGITMSGHKDLLKNTKTNHVAVMGTRTTIRSNFYQNLLSKTNIKIHAVETPLLVPLIEEGLIDHPAMELILNGYLHKLNNEKIDTVLLGCTHYPLISHLISKKLKINIIDPSVSCAEEVRSILEKNGILNSSNDVKYNYYVTDDYEKFQRFGEHFLQQKINSIKEVIL